MTQKATEKVILVLGAKSLNADKSIGWHQKCPNLADCDVLIVNLQSLKNLDPQERKMNLYDVRKYVFHLVMAGEKSVIFVLPSPEKISFHLDDLMPIAPILNSIERCRLGKIENKGLEKIMLDSFEDYLKTVKDCSYYISNWNFEVFWKTIKPDSSWQIEKYDYTHLIHSFRIAYLSDIWNTASQRIGTSFQMIVVDRNSTPIFTTSSIHFLPPSTEISVEEGIEIIINHLIGLEIKEPPPPWEQKIDVPRLNEVITGINQLNSKIVEITKQKEGLETEKNRLVKFRRLLWTKGENILQEAVKDAFIELGFADIRQERAKNQEDWIFNFKSKPLIGVLEVTGADKRTALKDLRKCADWVTDYDQKGKNCKGIFIPNQHRREEYPKSRKKREHFEKNEIQFSQKHNICILPSHVLFEAVVEKMKGNPKFNREFIEEKILSADPFCKFD